jgi:hypothetical protein
MGNKVKTAHGKIIDIDNLRLQNEKIIAVGNMKVNARGDQLGRGGEIIVPRGQVMARQYPKMQTPVASEAVVDNTAPDGESFDPPEETVKEEIKPLEPKLRGSLADSIAKQTTVTQETLDPDMYKNQGNKGPQRI